LPFLFTFCLILPIFFLVLIAFDSFFSTLFFLFFPPLVLYYHFMPFLSCLFGQLKKFGCHPTYPHHQMTLTPLDGDWNSSIS
jgi:hypothetical protein